MRQAQLGLRAEVDAVGDQRVGVDEAVDDIEDAPLRSRRGRVGDVGNDGEAGRDRLTGVKGVDRGIIVSPDDNVLLGDIIIVGGDAEPRRRLGDDPRGKVGRRLRSEFRIALRGQSEAVSLRIRIIAMRSGEPGRISPSGIDRDEAGCRQRSGFGETRRAEAFREGAAQRELFDRSELDADLGRELAETGRVIIVSATAVDFELGEHRGVDLEIARLDIAMAGRAETVDQWKILLRRIGLRIGWVGAGVVDRFVAHSTADRDLQRTAG